MTQHLPCRAPYTAKECRDCKYLSSNQPGKGIGAPVTPQVRKDGRCKSFVGAIR